MNERLTTATIAEIVASDSRAAAVFEQFGLDFCWSGRRIALEIGSHANGTG